jgi:hypothetical protein
MHLRFLGWTQEHKEDIVMYLGSGYQGPTSSSSSSLYLKAPKSGVTTRVCKRFGRRSLGAILWLVDGEVASPVMGKKDKGEEHSVAPL